MIPSSLRKAMEEIRDVNWEEEIREAVEELIRQKIKEQLLAEVKELVKEQKSEVDVASMIREDRESKIISPFTPPFL